MSMARRNGASEQAVRLYSKPMQRGKRQAASGKRHFVRRSKY